MARLKRDGGRGRLIANVLAGAWRRSPPPLDLSAEALIEITPLLLGSLGGALAWSKIARCDPVQSKAASTLRGAYRFHTIRTALREHTIKQALTLLGSKGVVPILVKGWAAARLYSESSLRP